MGRTKFVVVRRLTVRRDFTAGPESGSVTVSRDCGIGCTCSATLYKTAGPSAALAEGKTFCFNDQALQGISEIRGSARPVAGAAGATAFEVQADLLEARAVHPPRKAVVAKRDDFPF